jgi:hypothetical protein
LINDGRKVLDQPLAEVVSGGHSLEEVFARVTSRDDLAGVQAGAAVEHADGGAANP